MTTVHVTLRLLLVHWFTLLDSLQRFFGSYAPLQPTLSPSVVWKFPFRIGIEEDSTASVSLIGVEAHVPPIYDGYGYHGGPIDSLTTIQWICRVPIVFSAPLVMNLSCFIDPPDYDYDVHSHDAPAVAINPIYLDTPVWKPAAVPMEDEAPQGTASSLTSIGEDDVPPSHMVSYGTPGLSFCPVLVGITYVGSLVYLYMLLMIPSILYHWSEDLLAYDTLDPTKMLHASLWTTPWSLLRCCVCKAVPRIGRQRVRRPGNSNSITFGRPSIPLIVVESVDGEVIPVNFTDDVDVSNGISVGAQASLDMEENSVSHGQDVLSSNAGPDAITDLVLLRSPISSHSEGCVAIEIEAPVTWTDSHQGHERIGDVIRVDVPVGLGSLMSDQEFAEDVRSSYVNDTPDARLEVPHVLVGGEDDPFRFVEEDGLRVPILLVPDALGLGAAFSDCDVDKRTEELEWMTFLGIMIGDVSKDGMGRADDVGDVSSGDLAFGPWSPVSDRYGPDEPEMPSDTVSERSHASVGSQDTSILGEDVRFVMDDDASGADCFKLSLSGPHSEKRTCAWNLGSELGGNGVTLEETPVQPPDSLVDTKDATLSEQAGGSMLSDAMLGEERVGENDIVLAELVSPSLMGKPIVNLPLSLVTERDDVRGVEEDPANSEPVEDVATRSPLQMLYPTSTPAVVIKTGRRGCLVEAKGGQNLSSFQVLDHGQRALDLVGTLDEAAAASEAAVDVTLPREAGSCPPSPPIEGSSSLCHSRVESDIETHCGDIQTPVPLSALPVFEIDQQVTSNPNPIVADIIRNGAIEVHGAKELQKEVSYETRYYPDVPRDDLQRAEVGITDPVKTNTSELSMVSAQKSTGELDHVKRRDAGAVHRQPENSCTTSRPSPKRTLSGSIHVPSEPRPMSQMGNYVDRTCILYKTPHSVSMARFVEGKNSTGVIVTETAPEHGEDRSASIRAPQRASELDVQSTVSHSRDENNSHHRISGNLVSVSESKAEAKSCSPNWAAMPEVVDAFRMFKQAPRAKSIRRVSSVAEHLNRGPTFGIVGQKGNATHSLNNASAIANTQNRWMHGSGLLLVREVVSADPSDFNLRSCTNMRKPKTDRTNAMPVHQILYPGMHDIPRSMAAGSAVTQRPKSLLVPRKEEMGSMLGYQTCQAPYRD